MYVFLGMMTLGIFLWIIWRFSSRHLTLPCPSWLSWMVELDNPFTKTNQAHVIIGYLDLKPGMKILDVGCGPGRLTIPIAEKIGSHGLLTAMDMQSGMLQQVQEKAKRKDLLHIHYLKAKIGEGKLPQNYYDRALLVTVLGEIPDREAALKEIFVSLKPGGVLSVTEIIFDPHFQNKKMVLNLGNAVGFRKKKFIGNFLAYTLHLEKPSF